jgi:hypothetical protein
VNSTVNSTAVTAFPKAIDSAETGFQHVFTLVDGRSVVLSVYMRGALSTRPTSSAVVLSGVVARFGEVMTRLDRAVIEDNLGFGYQTSYSDTLSNDWSIIATIDVEGPQLDHTTLHSLEVTNDLDELPRDAIRSLQLMLAGFADSPLHREVPPLRQQLRHSARVVMIATMNLITRR